MQFTACMLFGATLSLATLNSYFVRGRSITAESRRTHPQLHNTSHTLRHTYHGKKIIQKNVHNKTSVAHERRRVHARKQSMWKTLTDTLTQVVLGDDDDYDYSSSSDSRSESDSAQSYSTKKPSQQSRWRALASSAFAGLAPRFWAHLTSKKKKASRNRLNKHFQVTTLLPLQAQEFQTNAQEAAINVQAVEESKGQLTKGRSEGGEEVGEVDTAGEDGIIAQQIYKMAARREDLAMLQQQVSDSGRRLSFIEYAAILEIMVLTIIAAGVFRTATFPVSLPVFAKA